MQEIVGVDGCRDGWFVAGHDPVRRDITFHVMDSIQTLMNELDPMIVAIDIPIGLADHGSRRCDRLARERLGPRKSSVFTAPARGVLGAASYEEACAISLEASGRKISRQTWGIVPKISEVDRFLAANSELAGRVSEVHPEVVFAEWNGRPMKWSKKSFLGMRHRVDLIERHFGKGIFERAREAPVSRGVADDDIVDALAALWTAERILRDEADSIPSPPDIDSLGLPMRMVY